ncbi:uncharacterized protein LOC124371418 [Homalodisca vitripennis]|uniref:uncharacterized protein LOC124371418 n=1 Tax=Homalodisca vitripennis TaxID=197043 RepID=UPI001EEAB363|nr:uncharacterized protein LOC124371418 [Homalodisca vitripennis]
MNEGSFSYKVRVVRDESAVEIPVCFKAFQSLFGVKPFRLHRIKQSIMTTGKSPVDNRGKHFNRPRKVPEATREAMMSFFCSLKGRRAHYSLHDSTKVYLPENLNVKELLSMFLNKNPGMEISYETFRHTFVTEFNIGFGYPRTDTCCFCDENNAKVSGIERKIAAVSVEEKESLLEEKKKLEEEQKLHITKADWFYKLKRKAKKSAKQRNEVEAIAIDFGKNLPTPNISTSEVYFRRQLTFYIFNVHILSTGESIMYTYDETVGKKGSDDVASFLYDFVQNYLSMEVKTLYIFADSCGGQNKNHTVMKMLHYLTTEEKRFDKVIVTFPVRGHSYMENDKNMGLIPKTAKAETPDGWRSVLENARVKPSPFTVVSCQQKMFKKWGEFLASKDYKNKFLFAVRPVKQLRFFQDKCLSLEYRNGYNGAFFTSSIKKNDREKEREEKQRKKKNLPRPEHMAEPEQSYNAPLALSKEKCNDLKVLLKFCEEEGSKEYYMNLFVGNETAIEVPAVDVAAHETAEANF